MKMKMWNAETRFDRRAGARENHGGGNNLCTCWPPVLLPSLVLLEPPEPCMPEPALEYLFVVPDLTVTAGQI